MKDPSCSSHITGKWVQYVVEEHLKKERLKSIPKVEIKDFTTGRGAGVGDGFNSELVTLDISATLTEGEGTGAVTSTVDYHFIAKFLSVDIFNKEMNKKFQSSLKEYILYSEYVNNLNELQSSHTGDQLMVYIPNMIYGKHSDKDYVLVLENIKYDGYVNMDKLNGLDFPHLQEAVIQLARFHALSFAQDKTQPFLERHPYFKITKEIFKVFTSFGYAFFFNARALLSTKKNSEELVKKIKASEDRLLVELLDSIEVPAGVPQCVLHGDYWNNNLMYKSDGSGGSEPSEVKIQCKVIDWGNSGWGSPVVDLHYLLYTSTTVETRNEHLDSVLKCYHSTYTEVTEKVGMPVSDWTYEEFLKEWKRLSVYGFIMGLGLSQGTLSKSNPMNKPHEPSVLDSPACLPTKFLVDGVKSALAKAAISFMYRSSGSNMMIALGKKMFSPVKDELLSCSNEAMNKRVLDLLYEADEKGLFDE